MMVRNNANLASFLAAALYSVDSGAFFELADNGGACQISLPLLGLVSGSVIFQRLLTTSLRLAMLSNIGETGSFVVKNNPALTSLQMLSLSSVDGILDISYNGHLGTLALSSLYRSGGHINIHSNHLLQKVAFPSFVDGNLNLNISDNQNLKVISLFRLYIFSGDLVIDGNGQLESLSVLACNGMSSGATVSIRNSASLESRASRL